MKEQMHEILMNLNRGRIAVSEAQEQLLDLFSVSNSLPDLVIEQFPEEWIASLKGMRGFIATGETEEEAINELMKSIKVMLLYNRKIGNDC